MEQLPNGQGFGPPTLHDLEGLPNGQGLDPPNPSRLGVAPKWTRVGPPQSDWTPQPFTTWRVFLSRKLTASVTKFCLYNVPFTLRCRPISRFRYSASSREGVALPKCFSESELSPAQPHRKPTVSSGTRQEPYRKPEREPASTASQKVHCFFRHPDRDRLAERRHAVQLVSAQFPPAQPHNKSIAFSGTRQDSLTESPHENLPTRPHRKPNPDRDRLTESQHAVPLVSAHNSRHCFYRKSA